MADEATLTLTLDPNLLDRFVAEAEMAMRPADDLLRDLVRSFVDGRHAVRDADDPELKRVPHEEVIARLTRQRADMVRRARGSTG